MNCSKCGATLRDGARFCSTCGFDTSSAAIGIVTQNASSPPPPDTMTDRQTADAQGKTPGSWPQATQASSGSPAQGQPGYPSQRQPGYPAQGQPGYPPQGQPGYPSQGQPGYPPQGQPGYPPQGQPGYPPQGQPGYPPQGQPGYPPQSQPGYTPQGQQGYPVQGQPGYPPQSQPGYPVQGQDYPPQGQPGYATQGAYPYGQPVKKKRKKVGCLGFLLVLILLGVLLSGVAFAGYQTFMPAKWTFGVAELNTINAGYDDFDRGMDRFEATRLKPLMDQPFSQQIEMGIQFDAALLEALGGMDAATAKQTADLVNSLTVKLATSSDPAQKTALADLSLFMKGNPFLGLNMNMKDKLLGLQLPDLSATRLVGDLSDPAIMKRLSTLSGTAPADPAPGAPGLASIGSFDPWVTKSIYSKVGIDRAALKKLVLDYAMATFNAIPASSMSINRSAEVEVLGKKKTLKEVTIDMTPEQFKAVVLKLMDKVEKDDRFYKLFIANYDMLLQIMGESSPDMQLQLETMRNELTREAFSAKVAKARKDYEAAEIVTSESAPDMVFKVYIDGFQVVRHAVDLVDTTGGDAKLVIGLDRVKQGEKITCSLNAQGGGTGQTLKANVDWSTEFKESTKTHNFTMNGTADLDVTGAKGTVALTLNSLETPGGKNEADRKVDGLLSINLTGDSPLNLTMDVKGGGLVGRDADGKDTNLDQAFDISVQTDAIPNPIAFKATFKTQYEYAKAFSLPKDSGKTLDLATATEEDLGAYVQEISPKLQELLATLVPTTPLPTPAP